MKVGHNTRTLVVKDVIQVPSLFINERKDFFKDVALLASEASPPSGLNVLCDGRCTYHNVTHTSNFVFALSRSPTMRT